MGVTNIMQECNLIPQAMVVRAATCNEGFLNKLNKMVAPRGGHFGYYRYLHNVILVSSPQVNESFN